MKAFLFLALQCLVFYVSDAQNPAIITSVNGLVTEPKNKDQNEWQNNQWDGKRFYQGTGSGLKLCVTDGTAAGTKYLRDLGANSSAILNMIPARDFIYIMAYNFGSPFTTDIWRSDGTAAGTTLVYTMAGYFQNTFQSDANNQFNYSVDGNVMHFAGYTAAEGSELWRTDGTSAGTYLVKDIKPGSGNSSVGGFCKIGNKILFRAAVVGFGTTLWETDGTSAGTQEIPVPGMTFFEAPVGKVNDKMIFFGNDATNGVEPWVTDGTAAGTFMLKDINPGTGRSLPTTAQNLHLKFNDKYVFFITEVGGVKNLWRTDGTVAGTIQLTADGLINENNFGGGGYSAIDNNGLWWIGANEKLYFSNGTAAGTRRITTTLSNALYMALYKGAAWFHARVSSLVDEEPWRSDGTAPNTSKALDVQPGGTGCYPYGFFTLNNKLYFFSRSISKNLYRYDGDFTFNNSLNNGRWRDSANWNSMMPPGITDTAYINTGLTVNVDGKNAYTGTLIIQSGSSISLAAPTDSLFIHKNLQGTTATGTGILVLKNFNGDTTHVNNPLAADNINAVGIVSINGNVTLNGNLNLTNNARLFANNNNVVLAGTTSTLTNTLNNYIVTNGVGKLSIENIGAGGRTGTVVFPVGTGANYNPVSFSNAGSIDAFSVRTEGGIKSSYTGEIPTGSSYTTGAVSNTWFITEGAPGGSNATVNLQWNASQELPGFSRTVSQLGHYTGGSWMLNTPTPAFGTDPYNITGTGITSFSPFSVLNNNATLPLSKLVLSVQKTPRANKCSWSIISDNGQSISLEKSVDGRSFLSIYNSTFPLSGVYDDAPASNNVAYYRIKLTDTNGAVKYSNIVYINSNETTAISIYPTLFQQSFVVQNNHPDKVIIVISYADGKAVLMQQVQPGTNQVKAGDLAKGIYFYQVISGEKIISTGQLMKQ